ncbi:MAG: hypothetical protein WBB67_12065 [bacterium]
MDISINIRFAKKPLKCWKETDKRVKHLFSRMQERGITVEEIKEAVQKGIKTLKKNGTVVAEHRWYRVIYRQFTIGKEKKIYPITVIEK